MEADPTWRERIHAKHGEEARAYLLSLGADDVAEAEPVIAEGSYEWYRREVERLRKELTEALDHLMDDGDVNDLMHPVAAERDALKAATDRVRALCDEYASYPERRRPPAIKTAEAFRAALDHPTDTTGETETPDGG